MRVNSWKVGIAAAALVWMVMPVSAVHAAGMSSPPPNQDPIFVTKPAPLSATQAATYAEAQAETAQDVSALATGEDEGGGTSGLEVVGVVFLVFLGLGALAVAASN